MLIQDLLESSASRSPDKGALCFNQEWWSYGSLDSRANRLAHALRELGVRTGDRVALMYENSAHYVTALFGILKAGAVSVALNTETPPPSLATLLEDSGARVFVVEGKFLSRLPRALPADLAVVLTERKALASLQEFPQIWTEALEDVWEQGPDQPPPRSFREDDLAALVYTSGSTARPKGVMLSHRNLVSNALAVVQYLGLTPEDRSLCVLPLHYIYGTSLLYTHFAVGGSVVLENRFAYPNVALDTLEHSEATGFSGVPFTFAVLLARSTLRKRTFPRLRYVTQAGGAMTPALQKEVVEAFHPAKLFVMYGSTEASPRLTYLDPQALPRKWGSIGKAIPGVEVVIADENGNRIPTGEAGEIAARGPNIMLGYWKDPQGTAEVLRKGWYFTGDLGREDEEGFLFVSGRSRDIIKPGGNRVNAQEIEEALLALPGVSEAAVIGIPDAMMGEAIKALIVPKPGAALDLEALKAELKLLLPLFKQPKWIEIRETLPRNAAGKVLKSALRAEAG